MRAIQRFLVAEAMCFALAALVHGGVLIGVYEHEQARTAETILAVVLFTGLVISWLRPAWTRMTGIAAQGFALLATLVGVFTIIVGVGPRTMPDVIYHLAIVTLLVSGTVFAVREPPAA